MASVGADQPMRTLVGGRMSFSTYFWAKVLNGADVGASYAHAALTMLYMAGASPSFDDDGDGTYDTKRDGIYARRYHIGAGVALADDEPIIGGVSEPQTIYGTSTATIVATNVTGTAAIESVIATVRGPGTDGRPDEASAEFALLPVGGNVFEGTCVAVATEGKSNQLGQWKLQLQASALLPGASSWSVSGRSGCTPAYSGPSLNMHLCAEPSYQHTMPQTQFEPGGRSG